MGGRETRGPALGGGAGPSRRREGRRGGPAPAGWGSYEARALPGVAPSLRRSLRPRSSRDRPGPPSRLFRLLARLSLPRPAVCSGARDPPGSGVQPRQLTEAGPALPGPGRTQRRSGRFLPPPRPRPRPLPGASRESRALRSGRDLGILGKPGLAPASCGIEPNPQGLAPSANPPTRPEDPVCPGCARSIPQSPSSTLTFQSHATVESPSR